MHINGYFHPETENYKFWSSQEEVKLRELVSDSLSFSDIGKILKRSKQSCQNHSTIMGLKNNYMRRKYSNNSDFWSSPNLLNCYWAGMSAADASIHKRGRNNDKYTFRMSLAAVDEKHLIQFKQDIDFDGEVIISDRLKNGKNYPVATLTINDNKWGVDLAEIFNIVPNKAHGLRSPNLNDDLLKLSYFIGYTDGDGCICLVNRKNITKPELLFRFTSCSIEIITWLKSLIDRIFPKHIFSRRNNKTSISTSSNKNYHSFAVSGMRALVLYNYLKDFNVPKLDRKWNRQIILDFLNENKQLYPHYFNINPQLNTINS